MGGSHIGSAQEGEDQPVSDPVPEEPSHSGLGITLEEFTSIPPSSDSAPEARINYLSEIPDESGRLAVPDLNGPMYLVEDGEPTEYLDIENEFPDFVDSPGLGTGFGFVTFHPEFADNGVFYTVHTEAGEALESETPDLPYPEDTQFHGIVTEWTADDPAEDTFSGTSREVLRIGYSTHFHGIQQIDFNPTAEPGDEDYGLLYIGSGDGESVPDFSTVPQDKNKPQGKILRIDPKDTDGEGNGYGIPSTNPFIEESDALDEVYALGLRNPHRFSWDDYEGESRMFLGNIGEQRVDSVYEVEAGDNFGWNEREGSFRFDWEDPENVYPLPEDDDRFGFTYPVIELDNPRDVNAVVGGFVYRGEEIPELQGKYIFSDVVSGTVYYSDVEELQREGENASVYTLDLFDNEGENVTMLELAGDDASRVDFRFGQDSDGELYVMSKQNGKIWEVTDAKHVITDVMNEEAWDPITPEKWEFTGDEVILAEAGEARPGPRRPSEYAILTEGPEFGSVQIDADVRIDVPEPIGRDVIMIFGYQSDTEFYYAHLSEDNGIYAHNGIFVVNNDDRERIDDQWDGSEGPPPAITDQEYNQVRITHDVETGDIAVFMGGSDEPLMTANDTTFDNGRIGFGSFDDIGTIRDLTVTGSSEQDDEPISAESMQILVENFDESGEFANEEASHSLLRHLTAVGHYENQGASEKVVQHMGGFHDLLDHQLDNELISEEAFDELNSQAEALVQVWE
ncbi:hypothetical protein DT065_14015 [Salicibibacter kimchii]|uniref:Uncharacterized protein n=2 Tax=Salicibibacter kimchii TaxID=2099786 RepID=A0A345C472_9BACI|nr:hypothetical protein DT065_14015 [Salicibibacter kimchii]